MKKSLGFTLAEVLITLAIIGVVAAMTIPSVIVNTNQAEFKTALKKAVSVLNSSMTMNIALEGESPYDNSNLFDYLQQHMSIMKSTTALSFNTANLAFYTSDGIRYEIPTTSKTLSSHEGTSVIFNNNRSGSHSSSNAGSRSGIPGYCGSYGVASSTGVTNYPCLILVDVNGDRKPNPANADATSNTYSYAAPTDTLLKDVFTVMITDDRAVPFGVVAQKAMYQSKTGS
ncbi:MAG: type II secretion system GspH family protein [Candidatus Gastranaerophilales bacterium]|nr:type II secretion system GspH family protein [Candidatus Gastranaerophilales bacterium]